MEPPPTPHTMSERDSDIAATVVRERSKLVNFIRRRVRDPFEAEDILQDVFHEFVQAYRLPAPIEQAGAWLFRAARNRIIDRFRKKKEVSLATLADDGDDPGDDYRLDLELPSDDAGPDALYARAVLLEALQEALDALPANQREVFIAHELEGRTFKAMAIESGVTVNTLLARKRYAVLHLRARLQVVYDELDI
ncbi:sigma-70 family RNA polymerase sigma factor [Paraburkholderia sp.]|uniref:RNA polymerase sigma factor n=1 Tax=Paraburkholderia sp. TaxID=1926495 RepID=UPI00238EDE54|nr:sigma-70 family RNA polymerase sigma factor [Paraburkholderia sp.]MDE1179194.1 sigma-70 family RNA polymerase sigma factor [Paraburkholderia sp.]